MYLDKKEMVDLGKRSEPLILCMIPLCMSHICNMICIWSHKSKKCDPCAMLRMQNNQRLILRNGDLCVMFLMEGASHLILNVRGDPRVMPSMQGDSPIWSFTCKVIHVWCYVYARWITAPDPKCSKWSTLDPRHKRWSISLMWCICVYHHLWPFFPSLFVLVSPL